MHHLYCRAEARLRELKYQLGYRCERLLFVHVPKSAGTTVIRYLIAGYPNSLTFTIDGMSVDKSLSLFGALSEEERFKYRFVYGHGAHKIRKLCHPETVKTTILRDPVKRLVSHYYFARSSPNHYLYNEIHKRGMSLLEYVESDLSPELRNNLIRRCSGIPWQDAEKNPIGALKETRWILREEYAVIGTVDDLPAWSVRIGSRIGLKASFPERRANITEERKKIDEIEPEVIATVQHLNKLDIKPYEGIRAENDCSLVS